MDPNFHIFHMPNFASIGRFDLVYIFPSNFCNLSKVGTILVEVSTFHLEAAGHGSGRGELLQLLRVVPLLDETLGVGSPVGKTVLTLRLRVRANHSRVVFQNQLLGWTSLRLKVIILYLDIIDKTYLYRY